MTNQSVNLRLGWYNGLMLGVGLAIGAWAPELIGLGGAPVRWLYPALVLGMSLVTLLGGLSGWLIARIDSALAGGVIGLATAMLATGVIVYLPFEGRTLIVWLSDRRFWGLPVYPSESGLGSVFAGLFPGLLLVLLGILQPYRLEGAQSALTSEGRLTPRAWLLLAWPVALAVAAGLITDDMKNRALRMPVQIVAEAIGAGRTYQGNLFELSRERRVNYNAIAGVRAQMSARYSLQVVEIDARNETVVVGAHFDNGAWIYCRVLAFNLSYCYDASPPYTRGFAATLTGEGLDDCQACTIRVAPEASAWLQSHRSQFVGQPTITFLAQGGRYVWMRAAWPGGDSAIECLFSGARSIRLESCRQSP